MCKDAPLAVMLNACIYRLKPHNICWSLRIGQIPKSRSFVTYSLPYLFVPKTYFHHFCWLAAWYITHFRVSVQTKSSCCLWYLNKTTSINFPNTATISLVNICHCHILCPHDIYFITKSLYLYLFCSSYYPPNSSHHHFVLSIYELMFCLTVLLSLDFTCKWDHMVSVFLNVELYEFFV